jgi:hypothetical protein
MEAIRPLAMASGVSSVKSKILGGYCLSPNLPLINGSRAGQALLLVAHLPLASGSAFCLARFARPISQGTSSSSASSSRAAMPTSASYPFHASSIGLPKPHCGA